MSIRALGGSLERYIDAMISEGYLDKKWRDFLLREHQRDLEDAILAYKRELK